MKPSDYKRDHYKVYLKRGLFPSLPKENSCYDGQLIYYTNTHDLSIFDEESNKYINIETSREAKVVLKRYYEERDK